MNILPISLRYKSIIVALFFISLMACKTPYYFPIEETGSRDTQDKLYKFKNEWYSKHLYSLREPILKDFNSKNKDIEIYRFTNLGTWSNPYTYRIEKDGSNISITKRRSNGQGGYHAGILVEDETKVVSELEWNELLEKLKIIDFWNLSTHEESGGLDGEEWILEGYKDQQYHFVTRWTPNYNGVNDYVIACEFFEQIFEKK